MVPRPTLNSASGDDDDQADDHDDYDDDDDDDDDDGGAPPGVGSDVDGNEDSAPPMLLKGKSEPQPHKNYHLWHYC